MTQWKFVHVSVRLVADDTEFHWPVAMDVGVVVDGAVLSLKEKRFEHPAASTAVKAMDTNIVDFMWKSLGTVSAGARSVFIIP